VAGLGGYYAHTNPRVSRLQRIRWCQLGHNAPWRPSSTNRLACIGCTQVMELGPLSRLQDLQQLSIKEPLNTDNERTGIHVRVVDSSETSSLSALPSLASLELQGKARRAKGRRFSCWRLGRSPTNRSSVNHPCLRRVHTAQWHPQHSEPARSATLPGLPGFAGELRLSALACVLDQHRQLTSLRLFDTQGFQDEAREWWEGPLQCKTMATGRLPRSLQELQVLGPIRLVPGWPAAPRMQKAALGEPEIQALLDRGARLAREATARGGAGAMALTNAFQSLATRPGAEAAGSVAGGSVAGGSVAGGSVAGGSVAGGSVAGGSKARGSKEPFPELERLELWSATLLWSSRRLGEGLGQPDVTASCLPASGLLQLRVGQGPGWTTPHGLSADLHLVAKSHPLLQHLELGLRDVDCSQVEQLGALRKLPHLRSLALVSKSDGGQLRALLQALHQVPQLRRLELSIAVGGAAAAVADRRDDACGPCCGAACLPACLCTARVRR
jgi:hypothetical protein